MDRPGQRRDSSRNRSLTLVRERLRELYPGEPEQPPRGWSASRSRPTQLMEINARPTPLPIREPDVPAPARCLS